MADPCPVGHGPSVATRRHWRAQLLAEHPDAERGRDAERPGPEEAIAHRRLDRPHLTDPSRRPSVAEHEAHEGEAAHAEDEAVAAGRTVTFSLQPHVVVASWPLVSRSVRCRAIASHATDSALESDAALDVRRALTGTGIRHDYRAAAACQSPRPRSCPHR